MTGVVLFRAQPFHNGHLNTIKKAFEDCQKTNSELFIFVGSADKVGTMRNPIPIDFRLMIIKGALHETFDLNELNHIHVVPLNDMTDESLLLDIDIIEMKYEKALAEIEAALAEKDSALAEKNSALAEKDLEIERLKAEIAKLKQR